MDTNLLTQAKALCKAHLRDYPGAVLELVELANSGYEEVAEDLARLACLTGYESASALARSLLIPERRRLWDALRSPTDDLGNLEAVKTFELHYQALLHRSRGDVSQAIALWERYLEEVEFGWERKSAEETYFELAPQNCDLCGSKAGHLRGPDRLCSRCLTHALDEDWWRQVHAGEVQELTPFVEAEWGQPLDEIEIPEPESELLHPRPIIPACWSLEALEQDIDQEALGLWQELREESDSSAEQELFYLGLLMVAKWSAGLRLMKPSSTVTARDLALALLWTAPEEGDLVSVIRWDELPVPELNADQVRIFENVLADYPSVTFLRFSLFHHYLHRLINYPDESTRGSFQQHRDWLLQNAPTTITLLKNELCHLTPDDLHLFLHEWLQIPTNVLQQRVCLAASARFLAQHSPRLARSCYLQLSRMEEYIDWPRELKACEDEFVNKESAYQFMLCWLTEALNQCSDYNRAELLIYGIDRCTFLENLPFLQDSCEQLLLFAENLGGRHQKDARHAAHIGLAYLYLKKDQPALSLEHLMRAAAQEQENLSLQWLAPNIAIELKKLGQDVSDFSKAYSKVWSDAAMLIDRNLVFERV